jgi:hypothetical protein
MLASVLNGKGGREQGVGMGEDLVPGQGANGKVLDSMASRGVVTRGGLISTTIEEVLVKMDFLMTRVGLCELRARRDRFNYLQLTCLVAGKGCSWGLALCAAPRERQEYRRLLVSLLGFPSLF